MVWVRGSYIEWNDCATQTIRYHNTCQLGPDSRRDAETAECQRINCSRLHLGNYTRANLLHLCFDSIDINSSELKVLLIMDWIKLMPVKLTGRFPQRVVLQRRGNRKKKKNKCGDNVSIWGSAACKQAVDNRNPECMPSISALSEVPQQ